MAFHDVLVTFISKDVLYRYCAFQNLVSRQVIHLTSNANWSIGNIEIHRLDSENNETVDNLKKYTNRC